MVKNCLLHNRRECSKRLLINNYKRKKEILIVYGFDWGSSTDTPALIYEFIDNKIKPIGLKYGMDIKFQKLGSKEGSIYCGICYAIQKADIAIFDISTHNLNVIFELGLAIGSGVYVYILKSRHQTHLRNSISDLNGILEYRFTRRSGILIFDTDLQERLKYKIRLIAKSKLKDSKAYKYVIDKK